MATAPPLDYLRDPDRIYAQSFAIIRAEAELAGLARRLPPLPSGLIHASGMTDIVGDLRISKTLSRLAQRRWPGQL